MISDKFHTAEVEVNFFEFYIFSKKNKFVLFILS